MIDHFQWVLSHSDPGIVHIRMHFRLWLQKKMVEAQKSSIFVSGITLIDRGCRLNIVLEWVIFRHWFLFLDLLINYLEYGGVENFWLLWWGLLGVDCPQHWIPSIFEIWNFWGGRVVYFAYLRLRFLCIFNFLIGFIMLND